MNVPVTITVTDKENEVAVNAGEVLIQLQKGMNEQKKFNQLLVVRLNNNRNTSTTNKKEN
ncbi:hypothetical protein FO484_22535 [Bacillus atrophaeus ATCC 9372]